MALPVNAAHALPPELDPRFTYSARGEEGAIVQIFPSELYLGLWRVTVYVNGRTRHGLHVMPPHLIEGILQSLRFRRVGPWRFWWHVERVPWYAQAAGKKASHWGRN